MHFLRIAILTVLVLGALFTADFFLHLMSLPSDLAVVAGAVGLLAVGALVYYSIRKLI